MAALKGPLLSVVIPTSGRWPLVRECLAALAEQSRFPDEVLLVCDGTDEPPAGLAAGLAAGLGECLRVLRLERGGIARARNAGIAQAAGDIVAFTDDDALASEGWLAALEDCFRNPGVAGAGGPVLPLWETPPPGWIAASRRARGCLGLLDLGAERRRIDPEADFLVGSNCAFRKPLVAAGSGFRGVLACPGVGVCGEDFELSRRIARAGPVLYEPAAAVRHRIPAGRMRWLPILQRAFYYEAARTRLGGALRPKRSLADIARRESLVSAAVVCGHVYGRLLRGRDRRAPSAGPLRQLAGRVRRRYTAFLDRSEPVPRFFKLEMAAACNLRCFHCDQWSQAPGSGGLPLERWLSLVDEIADWAAPCHLTISCGEPALEPGIFPVISAAQRRGVTVTLVSNGTLIDEACAARLRESGLRNMVVSLDGYRPETHDRGRGVSGTHARVLRALDCLAREGLQARTQLQAIVAGHNLDELAGLVRLAAGSDLAGIRFQALLPRGTRWRELWPQDAERAVLAIDGLMSLQASGSPILNPPGQIEAMKAYYRRPDAGFPGLACRCAATCAVDHQGGVFLCRAMAPVGDVRRNSLREAWRAEEVGRRMAAVRACHKSCILLNCHYQASGAKC
ncbi:MAG: glycosyltransferase [Elusimicrobia bacterium]|nr:glycosyltransferase [Elusimicrobiota bacterium]